MSVTDFFEKLLYVEVGIIGLMVLALIYRIIQKVRN